MPRSRKGHGPDSAPPARPLSGPWQDFPSLVVLVYPARDGMHLEVFLNHHQRGKRTTRETLSSVVWRPPAVTDQAVLRWAHTAVGRHLDRMVADARKHEATQ